jgi:hypothetical protein
LLIQSALLLGNIAVPLHQLADFSISMLFEGVNASFEGTVMLPDLSDLGLFGLLGRDEAGIETGESSFLPFELIDPGLEDALGLSSGLIGEAELSATTLDLAHVEVIFLVCSVEAFFVRQLLFAGRFGLLYAASKLGRGQLLLRVSV